MQRTVSKFVRFRAHGDTSKVLVEFKPILESGPMMAPPRPGGSSSVATSPTGAARVGAGVRAGTRARARSRRLDAFAPGQPCGYYTEEVEQQAVHVLGPLAPDPMPRAGQDVTTAGPAAKCAGSSMMRLRGPAQNAVALAGDEQRGLRDGLAAPGRSALPVAGRVAVPVQAAAEAAWRNCDT